MVHRMARAYTIGVEGLVCLDHPGDDRVISLAEVLRAGGYTARLISVVFAATVIAACTATPPPKLDAAKLASSSYDYPVSDPFAATVVATPVKFLAPLPKVVPSKVVEVDVIEGRKVPSVFWYMEKLKFSFVAQKGPAPLVFLIAGTGANHSSRTVKILERIMYGGGYHVITLPSPTHPNFIVAASSTSVPGRASQDAPDLYRAMQVAYNEVRDKISVTGFRLAGYSLGGWHAAFVARIDEQKRTFGFSRVLMLNPPVSLYTSVRILDRMAPENIPGGMDGYYSFYEEVIKAFADVYAEDDKVNFGPNFLYHAYTRKRPSSKRMAALIGTAFRISASNMIFTSDVMTRAGVMVPRNAQLGKTSSLTEYGKIGARIGFEGYLDHLLLPYYQGRERGLTKQQLIAESSLRHIEDWLSQAQQLRLVGNADDVILAAGEIDYLRRLFGKRGVVFPTGGHMGNVGHARVAGEILKALE